MAVLVLEIQTLLEPRKREIEMFFKGVLTIRPSLQIPFRGNRGRNGKRDPISFVQVTTLVHRFRVAVFRDRFEIVSLSLSLSLQTLPRRVERLAHSRRKMEIKMFTTSG